ncbi:MAG: pyridoxamine 5'-phosphate oxidase family protein [Clostridia bacterium]|nr:pyridoxamine 5'-phosphate oxidase family protein [Deltaproteobacteria bacterium]
MNTIRKSHRQHEGELRLQARRHAPAQMSAMIGGAIHDAMSREHAAYYGRLRYLPLGVADERGRLWATVLCNPETTAESSELLRVRARVNPSDPFVQAVCSPLRGIPPVSQFAGVAIDFTTRARIKLAGSVDVATLEGETLTLTLRANEHMGNCPKYITVRDLRPTSRAPQTTALGAKLSSEARALLQLASTIFIATQHSDADPRESDMGFNHRGGPKGFLRYFEDDQGAHLVLPDYSGNRFYQSLGNVETDPVMGVAIPDFASGALIQVSGRARNLFDDEASRIMPGASLITLITIDEAFITRGALDLALASEEQFSPYNPKLRLLASEAPRDQQGCALQATLVDVTKESGLISTFTFALSAKAELVPGGHAIFDFSSRFDRSYQHMNDHDPQSLNDDYVRTYTVTKVSPDRRRIAITVKKTGFISSYLHALAAPGGDPVEIGLKGFGGTFTCFEDGRALPHMVWVAGGVGITPFLAMYQALRDSKQPIPDIDLFYSCRGDEIELIAGMTDIRVGVFDSTARVEHPDVGLRRFHRRRLRAADFENVSTLDRATVFICGPGGFMTDVRSWVEPRIDSARLRFERFDF